MTKLVWITTILLVANASMAKDFKDCGAISKIYAGYRMSREADSYCGNKKKHAFAESEVFDDKRKTMWALDQFGRMGYFKVNCYKQSFSCVK